MASETTIPRTRGMTILKGRVDLTTVGAGSGSGTNYITNRTPALNRPWLPGVRKPKDAATFGTIVVPPARGILIPPRTLLSLPGHLRCFQPGGMRSQRSALVFPRLGFFARSFDARLAVTDPLPDRPERGCYGGGGTDALDNRFCDGIARDGHFIHRTASAFTAASSRTRPTGSPSSATSCFRPCSSSWSCSKLMSSNPLR